MAIFGKDGRKYGWAAGAVALVLSAAAITAGSASPSGSDIPVAPLQEDFGNVDASPDSADVTQRFADAPYGVDPVVTGPVSTAFKQQREAANCDNAVWPNVPAACYPD
ncbi:hypothetical protein [Mesorhizobium sp. IMUNJ 23232]|uniref:hypothetical protein n=1 Tax=Mesorhizobium sp. IMUNJ 23232 TaxID=3376064 RepID=UPI0037B58A8F